MRCEVLSIIPKIRTDALEPPSLNFGSVTSKYVSCRLQYLSMNYVILSINRGTFM